MDLVYADDTKIEANVKFSLKDKEIKKVGRIDISFIDEITNKVVSRVILDPYTADQLSRNLDDAVKKVMGQLDNKEIPLEVQEQFKEKIKDKNEINYFG